MTLYQIFGCQSHFGNTDLQRPVLRHHQVPDTVRLSDESLHYQRLGVPPQLDDALQVVPVSVQEDQVLDIRWQREVQARRAVHFEGVQAAQGRQVHIEVNGRAVQLQVLQLRGQGELGPATSRVRKTFTLNRKNQASLLQPGEDVLGEHLPLDLLLRAKMRGRKQGV